MARRVSRWTWMTALLATVLATSSCRSTLSDSDGGIGSVVLSANLVGTPVATLVVEVSAADIATPLVFNLTAVSGMATGTVRLPPGAARTITVRAYDSNGDLTHEGSKTIDVEPGVNPPVSIPMVARAGQVPITVQIGPVAVVVLPALAAVSVGGALQLSAIITAPNGDEVAEPAEWATTNPVVATVDASGLVTALSAGAAEIVATYAGVAGTSTVTVSASGSTLTVALAGTGSGTVMSSPPGINCPPDCSEAFDSGMLVTLTATPASGSTFAGWSGGCSGTAPCTVSITAATTLATATFMVVIP